MTRQHESSFSAEDRAKAMVLNHLIASKRLARGSVIATEFVLGKSGTRADLAVFGETLTGIEIKTAKDTLKRLPTQLPAYRQLCHRTILAIAPKHLAGVKMVGCDDLEIWLLLDDGSVRELSAGTDAARDAAVHSLLTQEEAKKLHRACSGVAAVRSDQDALQVLAARYSQSSRHFWDKVGRRRIKPDDIDSLSRFRSQRVAVAEWQAAQQEDWRAWQEGADRFFATA